MLTTNWPRLARMPKPNLPIVKAMASESGERRHVYDDPYDAKQRVRDIVDQRDETLAALAHLTQCETEQDGNEQHRQEISLRDRAEQVGGDHLHQEIDDRQRFGARHVAGNHAFSSNEADAMCRPAPGCHRLPTTSPTTRAIVETTSK